MLFTYCDTFCSFRTDKGVVMPKHVFLFSGSSAVGKTSILRYLIPFLEKGGMRTAICKIDCLSSNDESVYKNLNIPTVTGLSRDICPDHFLVSNLQSSGTGVTASGGTAFLSRQPGSATVALLRQNSVPRDVSWTAPPAATPRSALVPWSLALISLFSQRSIWSPRRSLRSSNGS